MCASIPSKYIPSKMSSPGFAIGGGLATPPRSRSNSMDDPVNVPAPRVNAFPDPGTFAPHSDHIMLKNMYDAITKLELWSWLYSFTPEAGKGFMFTDTPEIRAIGKETDVMGHSGASFGFCMRHMEMIAKQGWIEYYRTIIAPTRFT
jgi:hypothetical protein